MDTTTYGLRADPYNPQTNGSLVRYPGLTGFAITELDYAKLEFRTLASPMDPTLLQEVSQHPRCQDNERPEDAGQRHGWQCDLGLDPAEL